ncbi:DUF58 domain-containing protein [Variovorax sp. HJSM1_2]|uniref:DUF58 domain-containing protein n=1 Tax=Variovorax sp. HJSM1_2 TaxID=3366263 RepID=UPI003BEA7AAF
MAVTSRRWAHLNPFTPLSTALRRRFERWWQARLPLSDTLQLTQRNVYILPTTPGWVLAATLAVLLLASINYQLNLGYLLTFLLAGCAAVGMHVAHATLRGLDLKLVAPEAQFAGRSAVLTVQLSNSRRRARRAIALSLQDTRHWAFTDVPARGSSTVHVAFMPTTRGLHRVPALTAETRFPLGSFRVWCYWRPAAQLLVYPAPETHAPPLPPATPQPGHSAHSPSQASSEFDGVRAYRRGDPRKLIVWKKAAKSGELVSRDSPQSQPQALWLDLAQTGGGTLEARLSRLCAWVLQAEALGLDYGLRLPGRELKPDTGALHQRRCLEALALA